MEYTEKRIPVATQLDIFDGTIWAIPLDPQGFQYTPQVYANAWQTDRALGFQLMKVRSPIEHYYLAFEHRSLIKLNLNNLIKVLLHKR